MKVSVRVSTIVAMIALLSASCGKKTAAETPADSKPKPAANDAPPKPILGEPEVPTPPVDEDMTDEEEPSVPDNEPAPVPPAVEETPPPSKTKDSKTKSRDAKALKKGAASDE